MSQIFDALLLAAIFLGELYTLLISIEMLRWTGLRPRGLVYPRNCLPGSCQNPEGFRAFLQPRLFLFGILFLLAGAAFLCGNYIPACPGWLQWLALALILTTFVLYKRTLRRCSLRFW